LVAADLSTPISRAIGRRPGSENSVSNQKYRLDVAARAADPSREKQNRLDSHQPSHGRSWEGTDSGLDFALTANRLGD
jgi:hypothetical protein